MNKPDSQIPLTPPPKFGVPPTPCTCGRGDVDLDPNCPLHYPKGPPK